MCDVCSDVITLLFSHDERVQAEGGLQLTKNEVFALLLYAQTWQQRQCMCCFKNIKNFERMNNLVQVAMNLAIRFIHTLPFNGQDSDEEEEVETERSDEKGQGDVSQEKKHQDEKVKCEEGQGDGKEEVKENVTEEEENKPCDNTNQEVSNNKSDQKDDNEDEKEKEVDIAETEVKQEKKPPPETWTLEEKDSLFQFVTKIFLMNFPLYVAYKHSVHTSLEELSQQEASALNNYCELSTILRFQDPEVPVYLLRNVCFFCDRNGIQSIAHCFDKASPELLPYTVAHTLINIIANLRMWMNINTVMSYIVPLRSHVIRYMCRLSDGDLRMAGMRNMTDLMWAAMKEPIETHVSFDREGLDLAFKYFTCSTLTIRLAGIAQINNQINLYNEIANTNDTLMEADSNQLASWLIDSRIVEHIFGPNLHVELIKQSQMILNFLAIEGRVTNEHIDCIWAAGQLKHCGRQVHDILIPLIKNLEVQPAQHLLKLVSQQEPSAHTEQTLYLASALIKFLWNITAQTHVAAMHHHHGNHSQHFAARRQHEEMEEGEVSKHDLSDSESIDENEREILEKQGHIHKVHRVKAMQGKGRVSHVESEEEEFESENSSLCANSELSNISDESLPSELSESEALALQKAHRQRMRRKNKRLAREAKEEVSESDMDEDELSEGERVLQEVNKGKISPHLRQRRKRAIRMPQKMVQPKHVESSEELEEEEEEEEEDEEEEDEEEEEEFLDSEDAELMKHVVEVEGRETEESEEFSSECSEEEQECGDHHHHHHHAHIHHHHQHHHHKMQHHQQAKAQGQRHRPGPKCRTQPQPKAKPPHKDDKAEEETSPRKESKKSEEPEKEKPEKKCCQPSSSQEEGNTSTEIQSQESADASKVLNTSDESALLHEMEAQSSDGEVSMGSLTAEQKACLLYGTKRVRPEQMHYLHKHGRSNLHSDFIEDILSPDEGSCNSSRISNKSEKNMADFEGEEALSEDELTHINVHAQGGHFGQHHQMQQHLANMASMYRKRQPKGGVTCEHGTPEKGHIATSFEDVAKPNSTLIWDLLQDQSAHKLAEGIATEAEKVLYSLVCFSTDRRIRTKFIEACIENIANHRSVVISLRLLPKLLASFQQYRGGLDTHTVTMWAERELHMMKHFFNNLSFFTNAIKRGNVFLNALFSYKEEIQTRLQFLTCVFSSGGSTENFRLNLEQVDTLWNCLATDAECADDCFSWFLNQAKSKEHHAMSLHTFKHIFMQKMPTLKPENMSMIGLNLFTQLCNLAKFANASLEKPLPEDDISGMDQLWGIALRALNTDVSFNAIQYLNNYYINFGSGILEKEEEFVQRCMDNLISASEALDKSPDSTLLVIQRGLILMTNHLENFRRRYAFHLRNWQLDGQGIGSHQKSLQEKSSNPMRVILQPAGASEKETIEMLTMDLVAELRAEVTRWWETVQKQHQQHLAQQQQQQQAEPQQSGSAQRGSMLTPILGAMLGDGPIRMITLGQELTVDVDEKTLSEMQFKDNQLVLVSLGASRPPRKHDGSTPASYLPSPPRDKIPMMLLLGEPHFGQLFNLLQQLSNFRCPKEHISDSQEQYSLETKARVLSRKVWELLMLLPTNPDVINGFKAIGSEESQELYVGLNKLLDPDSPHKLMYSLQIVESLSRPPKHRRRSVFRSRADSFMSTDSEIDMGMGGEEEVPEEIWSRKFINRGGLKHLFNIFMSGTLQTKTGDFWNEWNQDCLAYLLRLMSQFAVTQSDLDQAQAQEDAAVFDTMESPRRRMKKQKSHEKIVIPTLNQKILSMIEVEPVLKILMAITYDAAMPRRDSQQWHIASWGRTEVVCCALSFLVSWAHSCKAVQSVMCFSDKFSAWLKRLLLEAPEPQVRQEACRGLYRLCMGHSMHGNSGYDYLLPTAASLLTFMPDAQKMKPVKKQMMYFSPTQEEKEPYGPGCRDFFWLLCRLIDNISKEDAIQSWEQEDSLVNLNTLAKQTADCICKRGFLERRHNMVEDDALIGLLHLETAIMKHNPPFKTSPEGKAFLDEVFWLLFALPSVKSRYYPKCKSQASRSAAYDLLVEMVKGCLETYALLHAKVLKQHHKDTHTAYTWDNWPHEEGRSNCGYVGLTNLGATCYMATCMQHLYMIPQARKSVLEAKCTGDIKHEPTLVELKKMFAYLMESERKAYNPRGFCKVYTMDKQPLNTGEQKDMAEFFTDLITKLEEMGYELKKLVKSLFGGIITNNVVSLDCPHVSRTKEEFYTVRCQVADMKNLYESLDEVCVKDMLEGDNMYTCSKCQKKVRAEKRACFRRLPKILCFNTMRYLFNMVTMMKEKVNSHFSFPLRLDMSQYMEQNLIQSDKVPTNDEEDPEEDGEEEEMADSQSYEYELIGVTVHTGTADGGHYYSFIRDRLNKNEQGQDKWYLFNDAEVKPFDPCQIGSECFGGEMTSKTYDSVTDKFMDFSFEKTNSAYMLFYERISPDVLQAEEEVAKSSTDADELEECPKYKVDLTEDLADWIWQDNMQFLQDKNIFEHTYFGFMWQMCSYIPMTLPKDVPEHNVHLSATQLTSSLILETLIHAKEKPTMLQWIELLTKQFNSCHAACEWFLDHMADDDWWPQQILIKCPNQVVRQMFQRLVIHVISQLKPMHARLYLQAGSDSDEEGGVLIGSKSCVTRFIKMMLSIVTRMEIGNKPQCKYLAEYFAFLFEFAKMGEEEALFMLHSSTISTMVAFFMGHKLQENYVEILSDDEEEEEEDVIALTAEDRYRPQSLDKMIALIAMLVEKSRGDDKNLHLSHKDYMSIVGGKGYPFLFNQIRDNINLRQTCNLIFSLCRWNDRLAAGIVQMIFGAITRLGAESQPFFKLLSMLVELMGGPPGMPPFTQYVLHKFWEVTDYCPQQCLEWLATQVTRNKLAHAWTLQNLDLWVEPYLLANANSRVRNAAAMLLVSLVPSNSFRQTFRNQRTLLSPHKDLSMSADAVNVLHEVYSHLLRLLPRARQYVDASVHGTMKLVAYFALMTYCLVSRTEKLMFTRYFQELWQLFQPKLSEPAIAMHHNKQALLLFWHQVCVECPENVKLIITNAHVTKHIAFNYILADHDDQEVVLFNRCMCPAYYGILRMCCQQSRTFTRQLACHQNIQWAFKNITPYPLQYTVAVDELFKMMKLMVQIYPDSKEDELKAVALFRRQTIQLYLGCLEPRQSHQTLITALKILIDSQDDRLHVLYHQGLQMLQEAFNTLHVMHHEATACHMAGDIVDLLQIMLQILKTTRTFIEEKKVPVSHLVTNEIVTEVKTHLFAWKDHMDFVRKLLTLLNSYQPNDIRQLSIDVLKEMVLLFQNECIQTIVPVLLHSHTSFQDNNMPIPVGPYFPKRGQRPVGPKSNIRPPRPQFQMFLHSNQLEAAKGVDETYDQALNDFFQPYHVLVDLLVRVAVNHQNLTDQVINLSAMVAYEGVPLHMPYFAKLWYEIYQSEHVDKNCIVTLCNSSFFIDYVDAVLLDERQSLTDRHIYQFFCNYFPKVYQQVLNDQGQSLLDSLIASITAERSSLETVHSEQDLLTTMHRLNGDLRALLLIFSVQSPRQLNPMLEDSLQHILKACQQSQQQRATQLAAVRQQLAPSIQEEDEEEEEMVEEEELEQEVVRETKSKDGIGKKSKPKQPETPQKEKENKNKDSQDDCEEVPRKRRRTCSKEEEEAKKKENPPPKSEGDTQESQSTEEVGEESEEKSEKVEASKEEKEENISPEKETDKNSEETKDLNKDQTRNKSDLEKDASQKSKEANVRASDPGQGPSSGPRGQISRGQRSEGRGQREKQSSIDQVAKNIEMIFGMLKK